MRSRGLVYVVVLIAAIGVGFAIGWAGSTPASIWAFWTGLAGLVGGGSAVIWWFATRRRDPLALLPLITAFFILEFAAGGIFYRHPRPDSVLGGIPNSYQSSEMALAVLLAFGAWAFLVLGYFVFATPAVKAQRLPKPSVRNDNLIAVAAVLWGVGMVSRLLMVKLGFYFHFAENNSQALTSSTTRQVVVTIAELPLAALALVGSAYYSGRVSRFSYFALVAVEVAWAVPSGERSRLVALALALIIIRFYASSRPFPIRPTLVAAALCVFVVFPFGAIYRGGGGGDQQALFQQDPRDNLIRTVNQMVTATPNDTLNTGLGETFRRFAGSTALAALLTQGRALYPASPVEALDGWLGAAIPRALVPAKADPSLVPNNFGRNYSILDRRVYNSAATTTEVGDLYGTFGLLPMLLGMFLIGGLLRGLDEYLSPRRSQPAALALYATVIGGLLLGFESTVAVGLIQTFRELVVYILAMAFAVFAVSARVRGSSLTVEPRFQRTAPAPTGGRPHSPTRLPDLPHSAR